MACLWLVWARARGACRGWLMSQRTQWRTSMAKIAINGLGRIGRATLKIVLETPGLDLVAVNDIGAAENVEYLLRYDTVYGRYEKTVDARVAGHLTVGDRTLTLLRE